MSIYKQISKCKNCKFNRGENGCTIHDSKIMPCEKFRLKNELYRELTEILKHY